MAAKNYGSTDPEAERLDHSSSIGVTAEESDKSGGRALVVLAALAFAAAALVQTKAGGANFAAAVADTKTPWTCSPPYPPHVRSIPKQRYTRATGSFGILDARPSCVAGQPCIMQSAVDA